MKHRNSGLTLIEMMVVITLLGLLMAAIATGVIGQMASGKIKIARTQIQTLNDKIQMFYLDENRYPKQEEGLAVLAQPSAKQGNNPYVAKKSQLKDPWGYLFLYELPGPGAKPYNLFTLGKDNKRGGTGEDADLSIWDEDEEKK